jgi:hypothetical protein
MLRNEKRLMPGKRNRHRKIPVTYETGRRKKCHSPVILFPGTG